MKRFTEKYIYGDGCIEDADGEFVFFTDHQAALAELAREVLPYIRSGGFLREAKGECTFEATEKLYEKLRALAADKP